MLKSCSLDSVSVTYKWTSLRKGYALSTWIHDAMLKLRRLYSWAEFGLFPPPHLAASLLRFPVSWKFAFPTHIFGNGLEKEEEEVWDHELQRSSM